MHFDVIQGKGLGNNALKSGDRDAVNRQTEIEHAEALDVRNQPGYYTVAAMPEGPEKQYLMSILEQQAMEHEASIPQYWDDEIPRKPVSQSSSWINGINYDPNTKMMMILTGRGRSYPVAAQEPYQVAEFVDSPSMEKFFDSHYRTNR